MLRQSIGVFLALCLVVTSSSVLLRAASLQVLVTTEAAQAAAGNANPAWIVVRLADENGMPILRAEIPKPSRDPNGGVELEGSKWGFRTLFVPPTFSRLFQNQGQVSGQLRIVSVTPYSPVGGNAEAGLYVLQIRPAAGFRRQGKVPIAWTTGQYKFLVSYTDGAQSGATMGTLTVR